MHTSELAFDCCIKEAKQKVDWNFSILWTLELVQDRDNKGLNKQRNQPLSSTVRRPTITRTLSLWSGPEIENIGVTKCKILP